MMWKANISKIINPACVSLEDDLVRVDIKAQLLSQKVSDFPKTTDEQLFARMNKHEIVDIPYIPDDLQFVFNKLIQFIHVYVCEQLGGQVAQRQTGRIAVNYVS